MFYSLNNLIQFLLVICSGIAIGLADFLIKKITLNASFWEALKEPWILGILLLYVTQIIFFVYVFAHGWKLGMVGVVQMVTYSIFVILAGIFYFGESFSTIQYIGFILALISVILINA